MSCITADEAKAILLGTELSGNENLIYKIGFAVPNSILGVEKAGNNSGFTFGVCQDVSQIVWSDPEIVFGYDFLIEGSDINFRSFILPILGDNLYELWLDGSSGVTYVLNAMGGTEYLFSDLGFYNGVSFFRILGVEPELSINPNDVMAFVTGLTFSEPGRVQWIQRPLSSTVSTVNEPSSILILLAGMIGMFIFRLTVDHKET